MQKKLYLMSESELKAFVDCSRELREAAFKMTPDDVKSHTTEILELVQINEIVEGEKISLEVDNGVAHIPIQGMLTNNVSPSAGFFGESITTYEFLNEAISQAQDIDQIKEIVFEINSGGGEVDGLEAVANAIFNSKKPTSARVHGMAASAAFWLASQANKIIATGRTSSVGSIGVAAEFIDRSAQDKAEGRKRVILTSTDAPEKRLDITTEAGQKQTINRLDEIHTVFVDQIVRGMSSRDKNINTSFVNNNFGKGSIMAADNALKVGMIDEIEGIVTEKTTNAGAKFSADSSPTQGTQPGTAPAISNEEKMDEKQFLAFLDSNPEAKVFHSDVIASYGTEITKLKTDHETALTEAKTQIESGKLSQADASFIGKILMSGNYGKTVCNCGVEVLTSENDMKTFKMLVSLEDEKNEASKLAAVKKNQPGATGGEQHDLESKDSTTAANAKALSESFNQASQVQ